MPVLHLKVHAEWFTVNLGQLIELNIKPAWHIYDSFVFLSRWCHIAFLIQ